jgi:hypothetical protein
MKTKQNILQIDYKNPVDAIINVDFCFWKGRGV